ncbi:MAG: hypothetical protein ACNA8L_08820 [Luteolibacter sp.]
MIEDMEGEELAGSPGGIHQLGETFDHFRLGGGEVVTFVNVITLVVKLDSALWLPGQIVLHDFPIARDQGAAAVDFLELPVEAVVGGLLAVAGEGGQVGNPLDVFR